MSNKVLLSIKKLYPGYSLENNGKNLIFNLQNIYYLCNSLCNLVSLRLFNNNKIY